MVMGGGGGTLVGNLDCRINEACPQNVAILGLEINC